MYKAPPSNNQGTAHMSTTSSVYSLVESQHGFHKSDEPVVASNEEGVSPSGSFTSKQSNTDEQPSTSIPPDNSTQTFQTYLTANHSLTSISENTHPYDNDETSTLSNGYVHNPTVDYIDDKTPIIGSNEAFNEDKTPIIGSNGDLIDNNHLIPQSGKLSKSPSFPPQELSNKFKRLSMTLQNSSIATSGDSHQFMDAFQQNVDKANNESLLSLSSSSKDASRTSKYYNRINESPGPDIDEAESSVNNTDIRSETSTISNRTSIASHEHLTFRNETSNYIESKNSSCNSSVFNFHDDTTQSNTTGDSTNNSNNSYINFRGSRVSPLKIVKKSSTDNDLRSDDVPPRGDLIKKFEKLHAEDEQHRQPLTEKYPYGLNISFTDSLLDPKNVSDENNTTVLTHQINSSTNYNATSLSTDSSTTDVPISISSNGNTEEEDLSSLFIRALHPFNSSTLQSESDASICLSFSKDDLAFVHTIDDSGWGEVTLVESLQRGWIPMNYFTIAVTDGPSDSDGSDDEDENEGKIPNSNYLKPLFHACGKFLMNPLSHKNRRGKYTFSIRVVNSIRDGVRVLLQETDCLSRSNEIVTKRPVVRRSRKTLLADWYNLMVKANDFKGTSNFKKVEILTLMVYQVIRKATSFLQIWSIEIKKIVKRENEKKLQNDLNNYPLLSTPPLAKQRVTEIHGILFSYLGLIIGRLDLIEHNSEGCDILELLTHQIILLLRELLFISKTGSDVSLEKPADLDFSLDMLLSLVSDLVTSVKSLVIKTINETDEEKNYLLNINGGQTSSPEKDYYYTSEGGELIQIAAKMIRAISGTISSIRSLLESTGDFKLNSERSYPDYSKMRIEADEFIRKCSIGIAETQLIKNRDLKALKPKVPASSNRYYFIRSGKTGDLTLTPSGANLLHDALVTEVGDGSPFSISNAEFEPFTNNKADGLKSARHNINDELLVDANGNLLGASFKGLVYTLTNENSPPEYFFVSTFFICFKSFASGIDLIEELITRFDPNNSEIEKADKGMVLGLEIKIKNRRRLIVKMFQLWLESYWNHEYDYSLLTTLINFFNEAIAMHLPLEALKLIEIAARLSSRPLIESNKANKPGKTTKQLITRSITVTRLNRKNSIASIGAAAADNPLTARYSMVDGYELSKINTNSSTSSLKNMTLPMPLGVGNQTSSSSSLLSKNQLVTIEKVNLTYRAILGESWCNTSYINSKTYMPLDLNYLLPRWFAVCDQSWVLSNYRPNLLDFNGLEIAKQLTIIESHIFCSIKPDELLNENFTSKRAYLKLAPNVRQSLLFTNCLSGYVLESILQPKSNLKLRLNMVKTWLKVAISCLYLRNFNSLAAIITALQSHVITRLTKVWSELSDKYTELYDYLSGIIHPEKNYNVYRTKLRNFLVSNDYNIPIVPYFSLFLQDLTFVTDGNPNYRTANSFLNQKLINIDKYLKITRIIADIESLQIPYIDPSIKSKDINKRSSLLFMSNNKPGSDDYHIISLPSLQELILLELWKVCQLNRKEEDRAWKLSCLIQPRETT